MCQPYLAVNFIENDGMRSRYDTCGFAVREPWACWYVDINNREH